MFHCHLTILVIFATLFSCTENKYDVEPSIGMITEPVYALVTLQPDSLYTVKAEVGGVVNSVLIEKGEFVNIDDQLMQITHEVPELAIDNARLYLNFAREKYLEKISLLNELREDVEVARLDLKYDSIYFFRQKDLLRRNIGTQMEYDTRKNIYEIARTKLASLMKRYERIQIELETQLKQAENSDKSSLISVHNYTVTSKYKDKVYQIFKAPYERLHQQESIALLGSADEIFIEMSIAQTDAE